MATARLSDDDKRSIRNTISKVINRALNNKKFPIKKDDVWGVAMDQMKKRHRKAYELLTNECSDLVTKTNRWGAYLRIQSPTHTYALMMSQRLPKSELIVRENYPCHAELLAWAEWYAELEEKLADANVFCAELIESCTSVGQVKRLLPDEALRFVPDHLLDFSEVERRSRVPAGFTPEPDRMDNLMQMLALGSLSPEKRRGEEVTVAVRIRRMKK
jgi:hypothetical protein